MPRYDDWGTIAADERGKIAKGRLTDNLVKRYPGLSTYAQDEAVAAALTEFTATTLEVFNVKAFKAKGDGVTDDAAAFQATINAAYAAAGGTNGGDEAQTFGGGSVHVPHSTAGYAINSPVILLPGIRLAGDNVHLIAGGGTARVLDTGVLSAGVPVTNWGSAVGVGEHHQTIVEGFHIRGTWTSEAIRFHNAIRGSMIDRCYIEAPTGANGILFSRSFTSSIRNTYVTNTTDGKTTSTGSIGIKFVTDCNSCTLDNVYVHACETAFKATGSLGLGIHRSTFEVSKIGIDLQDESRAVSIVASYIEDNDRGVVVGTAVVNTRRLFVDDCFFDLNDDADIDLVGVSNAIIGPNNYFTNTTIANVRTGANALKVIIDHGVVDDAETPWTNSTIFDTALGIVVHKSLQTSQVVSERTPVKSIIYYNGDTNLKYGSATWDPGSLADGVGETKDITVTGAAVGDYAEVSAPYDLAGMTQTAYVKAANTVSVRLQNESGDVINLGSGTWRVRVTKPDLP